MIKYYIQFGLLFGLLLLQSSLYSQDKLESLQNGNSIDWFDEVLKVAPIENHNCNFSTGSEKTKVYTGFNFKITVSGYSGTGAQFANDDNRLMGTFTSVKATFIESWLTGSSNASSGTSSKDKITQSKQICKDLGFKTNTEKFADCALKMMTLQFEASNKQVATGGGTQQQIIIKEQQDYNIFDAMIDLSLLNTAINSAPTSNNTNCRVVKKHWGADLICR